MVETIVILSVSVALMGYWFRSTVALILETPPPAVEDMRQLAAANHLGMLGARPQLGAPSSATPLPMLCKQLRRDYRVLTHLLRYGGTGESYTAQQWLLVTHFHLANVWFAVTHRLLPGVARMALAQMAAVLEYFAGVLSQRLPLASQPIRR